MTRRAYEQLNHCVFSDTEWERIVSEAPIDGKPIQTRNGLELALYLMPNGSKFATLKDASEVTWEAYCKLLASGSVIA